ncbi:heat shock factor-binding protein-like [Silene latifolia]|uniref:heat shock factor-binding protein-like n=1 Tax=Silene latifolia TaxID=37657 RepID=UPI003D77993E
MGVYNTPWVCRCRIVDIEFVVHAPPPTPTYSCRSSHFKLTRFTAMDGHDSDDHKQNSGDMTAFVQNLLQQMQSRFQAMSETIVTKIDEMGNRIDELEQSINELKSEMGADASPSPVAPSKSKPAESKSGEGSEDI